MNIGIDIDGVLTDIQAFHFKHGTPFFKKKFSRDVVDKEHYDVREIFKCSEKEWHAYWKKHLLKYVMFEPARKEAKEIIRKLRNDGHSVFIITKRVFTCQDDFMGNFMRFIVRVWLLLNGIFYKKIVFCDNDVADSKKSACLKNHIDIIIDDEPVNIETVSSITKVICFDTSYNHGCEGENVFRARNWEEIYRLIAKINLGEIKKWRVEKATEIKFL